MRGLLRFRLTRPLAELQPVSGGRRAVSSLRDFLIGLAVQFTSYIVLTINFRAIASERYLIAGGTAALAAILAYTIVRRIVKDETRATLAGMITGGSLGDMAGIWLTRVW